MTDAISLFAKAYFPMKYTLCGIDIVFIAVSAKAYLEIISRDEGSVILVTALLLKA